MLACENYLELISRYVDDDLDQQEEQYLQDHIQNCDHCRAVLENYQIIDQELHKEKEKPPHTLHTAIMRGVRQEQQSASPRNWLSRGKFTLIAAAAAVLLIVISRAGIQPPSVSGNKAISETNAVVPMVSASLQKSFDSEKTNIDVYHTDEGGVDARLVGADESADSIPEILEASGRSGTVFYVYNITEAELQVMLGELETVDLNTRQTIIKADRDLVLHCIERGELEVVDSAEIAGNEDAVWIVLE